MIAIFDIDGTLTESQSVDNDCFVAAFDLAFGIHDIDTNWSNYAHTTERALTSEILRRAGFGGEEAELERHRELFVRLLSNRAHEIGEIAGAQRFLGDLERRGWSVVLATGAWSHSARVKLRAAGFDDRLPLACCDAAMTREEIVRHAITLGGGANPVVLFGDAPWDVRTARALGLPIVGVGPEAAGADMRIADYRDPDAVYRAMIEACRNEPPTPPR